MADYLTPEQAAALGLGAPPAAPSSMAPSHTPSVLSNADAAALGLPGSAPKPKEPTTGDKVRKFFDPTYGENRPPDLGDFARQGLRAGALLGSAMTGGAGALPLLASGGLFGLGTSTEDSALGMAKDAAIGAGTGYVGGKAIQALAKATLWPNAFVPEVTAAAGKALDPRRPLIRLTANPMASGAGGAVAAQPVQMAASHVTTTEPAVGGVVKSLTGGEVTPTENAQVLLRNGVRLSRGQQNPISPLNQLEQAHQSTWPFGTRITAQRAQGPADLQIAALNQALPPGMKKIEMGTPFDAAMGDVSQGFQRAYGEVGDFPVYPAIHGRGAGPLQGTTKTPGLAEQAAASVKRLTDSQRGTVVADVNDLLSQLPPRKGAIGQVSSSDLINLRSTVRARAREWRADHTAESSAMADAYDAVDDAVTAALESQLPRSAVKQLQATDKAYRQFKTVDRAVLSARSSPDGFSARQLAAAAANGASGTQVGTQSLGPLYDLGIAGADVFRTVSHPTGERLITLSDAGHFLPGPVRNLLQGGSIARANSQAMSAAPVTIQARAFPGLSAGEVGGPPGAIVPAAGDQVSALVEALRRAGRLRFASPASADEETPRR